MVSRPKKRLLTCRLWKVLEVYRKLVAWETLFEQGVRLWREEGGGWGGGGGRGEGRNKVYIVTSSQDTQSCVIIQNTNS